MKKTSIFLALLTGVIALTAIIEPAVAQERERPQRGQRGDRGGDRGDRGGQQGQRGGFNREDLMRRMAERMRERYGFTEAEWKVIGPKFTALTELNMSSRGFGGFGGFGGRGGRGGDRGGDRPVTAQSKLRDALEDGASASEIKELMAAYRKEKAENAAKLKRAQEDLRQLLTLKQEARAVVDGLLP